MGGRGASSSSGNRPYTNYGIGNLPKSPETLLKNGWKDITPERMKSNTKSTEYINPPTHLKVRFDPGKKSAVGFKGNDHYHIYNPNSTGEKDYYLDKNGKPVAKGSKASHIIP